MEKLHPGAKWYFRVRFYSMFFFFSFFALIGGGAIFFLFETIYFVIVGAIVLIIVLGEVFAKLSYDNWGYEFTKTELRIQRGIIFKNYHSVPYSRIQNVDIARGILARAFGYSAVNIHTAGYSAPSFGGSMGRGAEGYIPALSAEKAEKIRDWVTKSVSGRSSGL